MSTILPSGASDPDPERTPDDSDYALESHADVADETAERKRRPWWVAIAVLAIALVLVQLAIYNFRNDSYGEEAAQEPSATAPEDPSAPESAQEDEPAVPTEGGYVDPEGAQEVPYEPAPVSYTHLTLPTKRIV